MKIAMILDSSFPPDPRVENEADTLINQGHIVHLFCLTFKKGEKEYEVINGIEVFRIKVPKFYRSISALAYSNPVYHFLLGKKLAKVFDASKYHTVHIHDIQSARTVFDLVKLTSARIILDLHENRPEIMKYYEHVTSKLGKLLIKPSTWKRFEHKYIKEADKVIVVTEAAKQYYLKLSSERKDKFVVVPNTVRNKFYENAQIDKDFVHKYDDKLVLLYIGDTGRRRGIGEVLDAINILKQEIPNLMFICVGKSKSDVVWNQKIKNYKLENFVKFLGWQKPEKFPTFLTASDICISPLHKNIHHDTTYANKLFQYMAFKKPVIVSNCDAQSEIVKKNNCGLVYTSSSVEEMVICIKKLGFDKNLRTLLGQNGFKAVDTKYNWENFSKGLINLYNEKKQPIS